MSGLLSLLLVPVCLLSQGMPPQVRDEVVRRGKPAEPAIEFTTTSNASQVGTGFVLGYQFSVQSAVMLNSLGAVLQGSGQPLFGALPPSMPVGLWDDAQNLLVSATVSASDPVIGHFRYATVADTLLLPGVTYTIAGLVPAGRSVLSNVPDMVSGSAIVYGGPRSFASPTLAYPAVDQVGLLSNYFGASFTYTGGARPVARSGWDRTVAAGNPIKLDGSASFSTNGSLLTWNWNLISVPPGSTAKFAKADSATPSFVPDLEGVYVVRLIVHDGSGDSKPSTVSITTGAGVSR